MKILVTGGTGYIGSHTVVCLIEQGYEVVILDNLSNSSTEVLHGIKAITNVDPTFIEVDLADSQACAKAFQQIGAFHGCIHFAALKAVGESVEKPLEYYKNNLFSMLNVISNIRGKDVALIHSSSCTVYGNIDELPATEERPIQKAYSPYGSTKVMGEQILEDIAKQKDVFSGVISLRYFNPIGAHASAEIGELPLGKPNNLMPFITQTVAGLRKELHVFGGDYNTPDGTAVRDYIHVVDLAEVHVIALKRILNKQNRSVLECYNVGTGKGSSVLEVIKSFERSTGQKVPYKIVERRAGDVEAVYAGTEKISKALGWKARFSLDQMTASAWQWEKKIRGIA